MLSFGHPSGPHSCKIVLPFLDKYPTRVSASRYFFICYGRRTCPQPRHSIKPLPPPGNDFVAEDLQHSWSDNRFLPFEIPFLRIWDLYSGNQPDGANRMMSRPPRQSLDTWKSEDLLDSTHHSQHIGANTLHFGLECKS